MKRFRVKKATTQHNFMWSISIKRSWKSHKKYTITGKMIIQDTPNSYLADTESCVWGSLG